MSKRNVSRSSLSTKGKKALYINIRNINEDAKRQYHIKAYDKDSETKDALPIFHGEKRIKSDVLGPGEAKRYKVDVSNVPKKAVFEISQVSGGTGLKVTKNSQKSVVEMQLK